MNVEVRRLVVRDGDDDSDAVVMWRWELDIGAGEHIAGLARTERGAHAAAATQSRQQHTHQWSVAVGPQSDPDDDDNRICWYVAKHAGGVTWQTTEYPTGPVAYEHDTRSPASGPRRPAGPRNTRTAPHVPPKTAQEP